MDLLTFLITLFVPSSRFKNFLLNSFGHRIASNASIGFCLVWKTMLDVGESAKISNFSLFKTRSINLESSSKIGFLNIFIGEFDIKLSKSAEIANFCTFKNAGLKVIPEKSVFALGGGSKLTSKHYIDMSSSVLIGGGTVVGGRDTQIWTHGFLHINSGKTRFIKFDEVVIGDGVYIGSRCTISPGAKVENNVNIAAASSVSGLIPISNLCCPAKLRVLSENSEEILGEGYEFDYEYKCGNPRITKKLIL